MAKVSGPKPDVVAKIQSVSAAHMRFVCGVHGVFLLNVCIREYLNYVENRTPSTKELLPQKNSFYKKTPSSFVECLGTLLRPLAGG